MDFLSPFLKTPITILVPILVFSYYILKAFKPSKKLQKAPQVAGGWPFIGHLHLLRGPELTHITLGDFADKYGPIFRIRVGVHETVVISSYEVAKECYTTNDAFVSSRPRLVSGEHMGYNNANFGFSPYGPYWREIRKISASELLSSRRLELQNHVGVSEVRSTLKKLYEMWREKRQNYNSDDHHVQVELKQWVAEINLNVMLRMVCGKRLCGVSKEGDEEARKCRESIGEFFHLLGVFCIGDAIPFLGWMDLGGHVKAMKRTAKKMDGFVTEWVAEHRRRSDSGEGKSEHEKDFMDVMLSLVDGMEYSSGYDADTIVKATCMMLISGATDTISVTIIWTIALLLNDRKALKKVQDELNTLVGNQRLIEESDLDKLVYLKAVVKESMRLYPAGPLGGIREFTKDCNINGYHVPKGTRLITNVLKIQTDPRICSDPLKFKPERFLSGKYKDIDIKGQNFELIPFGSGRRICPGLNLAFKLTCLMLANFLHAFEITTLLDQPVDMTGSSGLTNMKASPLHVLVKPRLSPNAYE